MLIEERKQAKQNKDLDSLKKFFNIDKIDVPNNDYYNFTAVVESMTAQLYFLPKENFEFYFKFIGEDIAKFELEKRLSVLKRQINTINEVGNLNVNKLIDRQRPIEKEINERKVWVEEQNILKEKTETKLKQEYEQ